MQAQQARRDRNGKGRLAVERDLTPFLGRELDADTIDERRERTLLGLEEGLVHLVAAADVNIEQALVFREIEKDREKTLPSFLKQHRDPVAALDHSAQLEDHLARVAQRAAFEFLFGVGSVHGVLLRIPVPEIADIVMAMTRRYQRVR